MEIRERLIALRNERRLSQQELADLLNVSRTTVARWESGKNLPSSAQISNICRVFRLDVNAMLYSGDIQSSGTAETLPSETRQSDDCIVCGQAYTPEGHYKPCTNADNPPAERKKRRTFYAMIAVLCVLALVSAAGLAVTVFYAVKDASYDTGATVWIMTIPRNTPMIVLCIFLSVIIVLLVAVAILLIRRRK